MSQFKITWTFQRKVITYIILFTWRCEHLYKAQVRSDRRSSVMHDMFYKTPAAKFSTLGGNSDWTDLTCAPGNVVFSRWPKPFTQWCSHYSRSILKCGAGLGGHINPWDLLCYYPGILHTLSLKGQVAEFGNTKQGHLRHKKFKASSPHTLVLSHSRFSLPWSRQPRCRF